MNIGEVIKLKRQQKNVTQAELADMLRVTPQAVSRWEMGISLPDIAMVPLISEALQVTADELLGIRLTSQGAKPESKEPDEVLNQSQADSIFNYIPAAKPKSSKKILVVDDADFMRMVLEDMLTKQGHTVLQAKDGQECLDMLQNETVDVCVLDIVMPGIHGIAVLEKIKEKWPDVKVVMLSAQSTEKNIKQAMQLGADSFVVKPFQGECLIERVG